MSSRAGSALIAALIVMAVLGFLWVGDWVLRLTDEMTRDRVIQMEQSIAQRLKRNGTHSID